MQKRRLGKTELLVSEIGFGAEWLNRHTEEESVRLIQHAGEQGINIIDTWMPDPKTRDIIGKGIAGRREQWLIQGHLGSIWQNGQSDVTREVSLVDADLNDILNRMGTDYLDIGVIHYVDSVKLWEELLHSDFLSYILARNQAGIIRHIGLSTHNPQVAKLAAASELIGTILFSINPAYDMLPPSEDICALFADEYDPSLKGVNTERAELYQICKQKDVGLTVMKPYAGGRLFSAEASPFGVALSPVQCIHYALCQPAVASVMCGYDSCEQIDAAVAYETAAQEQKEYASVLANAPLHSCRGQCTYCGHCKPCAANLDIAMINKLYDLAVLQPEIPATVKGHYLALEKKASQCLGCHDCEQRCPFGVPIADRMAKAAKLFGQ